MSNLINYLFCFRRTHDCENCDALKEEIDILKQNLFQKEIDERKLKMDFFDLYAVMKNNTGNKKVNHTLERRETI